MRMGFLRFGIVASTLWAAVTGLGNRVQAMQVEPSAQEAKIALFISSNDDDDIEQHEQAPAPKFWLGIALKPIEGDLANYLGSKEGVLVDSVYPDSPASKAGLEKGDIVVAVGEQKLADPKSLLTQMLAVKADEDGKASSLKLKVLRKGESKSIELTPVERPAERMKVSLTTDDTELLTDDKRGKLGLSLDLSNKSPEEIEKMMEKLHGANSDVRILRFGAPAKVYGEAKGTSRSEIHKIIDGKNLEVVISREGDAPAKITVVKDGESKVYSSEKLDELPQDVRKIVTETLAKEIKTTVEKRKSGEENQEKMNDEGKQVKDRIAEIRERIAVIGPKGTVDLAAVMDKEMAERVSAMAKEIAARAEQSSKWAQAAVAVPEEVKELKSQVESLRAEIKELREQLKASVKQPSEQ